MGNDVASFSIGAFNICYLYEGEEIYEKSI